MKSTHPCIVFVCVPLYFIPTQQDEWNFSCCTDVTGFTFSEEKINKKLGLQDHTMSKGINDHRREEQRKKIHHHKL